MFHLTFTFSVGEAIGSSIVWAHFVAHLILQNKVGSYSAMKIAFKKIKTCHLAVFEGYSIH
jgi:hypothetical protein